MTISIIVAIDHRNGIGINGQLLYHLRDDMRHFRELTTGHTIIMGRKTFESFPKGALPNRRNIVVTRNNAYTAPGAETTPSLDEAFAMCQPDDMVYIIGGGEIYRQAMDIANRLDITLVDADAPADTYFPAIDPAIWSLTEQSEEMTDTASGLQFRFITYLRNS